MINIEKLYINKQFLKFANHAISINIKYFSSKADRSDYMNDIFAEILFSKCDTSHDCKLATWRVLERERRNLRNYIVSIPLPDNNLMGAHYDTVTI